VPQDLNKIIPIEALETFYRPILKAKLFEIDRLKKQVHKNNKEQYRAYRQHKYFSNMSESIHLENVMLRKQINDLLIQKVNGGLLKSATQSTSISF